MLIFSLCYLIKFVFLFILRLRGGGRGDTDKFWKISKKIIIYCPLTSYAHKLSRILYII